MRLAKVTLTAFTVLDPDQSVAGIVDEDLRTVIASVIEDFAGKQFGPAGGFGRVEEGWHGLYQVDVEEMVAHTVTPADLAQRRA